MRVRIRFNKVGKIRFVGHRDVARLFERALRKVGFPVVYSEGFSPRVKVSFGLALPTCYESDSEYVDIPIEESSLTGGRLAGIGQGLGQSWDEAELAEALTAALPTGMDVTAVVIEPRGGPSLQESVVACTWCFDLIGASAADVEPRVEAALASDTLVISREKKGKTIEDDIRPAVHMLRVDGESDRGAVVIAELSASPRVVRPSELLGVIAPGREIGVARRLHQWIESDGARCEPLPTSDSTPAIAGTQEGTPT